MVAICSRINQAFDPSFALAMLKAGFYSQCKNHKEHRVHNAIFFCWNCKGRAFCASCKESQHPNHCVTQVYKTSRRTSLRIAHLKKLLDVSDIHPFSFNKKLIVFLYARSKNKEERQCPQPQPTISNKYNCRQCGFGFKDCYKFCSIECKLSANAESPKVEANSVRGAMEVVNTKNKVSSSSTLRVYKRKAEALCDGQVQLNLSYRKRRRKQLFPQRAPQY
ncbi:PLATZ transcription factor family protein [Parasponia andersonii]|uniref:PLATZ transcription factor family protein n=1 Tax=Parasponia andersonii TaxID=3476 RepID=A0A2P5DNC3_PARAD|nr:PLATZ transcription factor family protein [Parasponia andersonii]